MNLKAWQNDFDVEKWFDSIVAGIDCCGNYEFCEKCDKNKKYPCARAAKYHQNNWTRIAICVPKIKTRLEAVVEE